MVAIHVNIIALIFFFFLRLSKTLLQVILLAKTKNPIFKVNVITKCFNIFECN